MANNPNANVWTSDVKHPEGLTVDPSVLPQYTLLPPSPRSDSVLSYRDDPDTGVSASNGDGNTNTNTNTNTCGAESWSILKALSTGLLAIVLPPVIIAAAALAAGAAGVYGCGKLLEGTGRALAFGPEVVYRACVAKRARKVARAFREGRRLELAREREREREEGVGEGEEGRVVLEDVEAGRGGGPISI